MESAGDWFADPHLRTWLILMLLCVDIALAVLLVRMRSDQQRRDATVQALVGENVLIRALIAEQRDADERELRLLAEMVGHVEVALGRTYLSAQSRELLERARGNGEAPGVDPAGERIPSGTGAPPL